MFGRAVIKHCSAKQYIQNSEHAFFSLLLDHMQVDSLHQAPSAYFGITA